MKKDVVIIGAGPGGIFAAYELVKQNPDIKVAVFEAGHSLNKRKCPIDGEKIKSCIGCKSCSIMSGFGGAGAFSDGKYNITNDFGGTLYEYVGKKHALELMQYVDENDYIISCVYDSIGRDEMKRFFYTDFVGVVASVIDSAEDNLNKSIDPGFKAYVAKFYTEALAGMLIDWAKERDKHDREKVVGYLTSIIGFALKSMELYEK